jgi:YD repeat-containing protein
VPTDDELPVPALGVRTTVRIDRPDGSVTEVVWDDSGRVTTTRLGAGGDVQARAVGAFDESGSFLLDEPAGPTERSTNPFGALVERSRHADGTVVERAYDADARLRRVRVAGAWGSQALEVRPDGSRVLRWRSAGLRGVRRWDAAAATTSTVEVAPDDLGEGTWEF